MNPINNSFTSIEQVTGQYLKTQDNKTKEKTTGLSFEDVLRQQSRHQNSSFPSMPICA